MTPAPLYLLHTQPDPQLLATWMVRYRTHDVGEALHGLLRAQALHVQVDLAVLGEVLSELATPSTPGLPPFHAGMVGYLGYDVVRRLERLPETTVDDLHVPELTMMLASEVAVLDHHRGEVWLIANAINYNASDEGVERAYVGAVAAVERMAEALRQPAPQCRSRAVAAAS